ncbi:MAG: hypothetical protein V9H69_01155 [Anaerolineae bacterium]
MQAYIGVLKNTNSATKTLDDLGTVNLLENLRRKLRLITNGQSAFQTFVGVSTAATIVSGIVGITLFSIGSALDNNPLKLAGVVFLGFALAVATIVAPLLTLRTYIQEVAVATQVSQGAAAGKVLGASSEIVGLTKVAAVVGLVISIGIPWGVFIYQALSGDVRVGTIAFNTAMAFAIASTIVAIVMFALSLTVVGFITTAVLGFVDLLLQGLCAAGVSGACFSIVGALHRRAGQADLQQRRGDRLRPHRRQRQPGPGDPGRAGVEPFQPGQRLYARQPGQLLGAGALQVVQQRAGRRLHRQVRFLLLGQQPALLHRYLPAVGRRRQRAAGQPQRDERRLAGAVVPQQALSHLVWLLARQQHHQLPHRLRRPNPGQPVADADQGDGPAGSALSHHGLRHAGLRVLGRLLLRYHPARRHQDLPGRQPLPGRLPGHPG